MFSVTPNSVHLLYSKTTYSSTITTTYMMSDVSAHAIAAGKPEWSEHHFDVYTADGHEPIQELNDLSYTVINGKDKITFASQGTLSFHHDGQVVYSAILNNNGTALAERHSTNNQSIKPKELSNNLIIWLGYQKANHYQLYAASTNAKAIAKSIKATQHDIGQAISNALIILSVNIFAVFFALIYSLIALLFYFICYFAKTTAVENGAPFVRWGTYIIFFISQFIYLYDFLIPKLIPSELPFYLNFHRQSLSDRRSSSAGFRSDHTFC